MTFLRSLFKSETIKVAGNWIGSYSYGDQYPEKVRGQKVKFTAEISEIGDGKFVGSTTETGGVDEIGRIEGKVTGSKIAFEKSYTKSYAMDDNGSIEVGSHGPQYIIYEGLYDKSSQSFRGVWRIEATYLFSDGRKVKHTSSGGWTLQRS